MARSSAENASFLSCFFCLLPRLDILSASGSASCADPMGYDSRTGATQQRLRRSCAGLLACPSLIRPLKAQSGIPKSLFTSRPCRYVKNHVWACGEERSFNGISPPNPPSTARVRNWERLAMARCVSRTDSEGVGRLGGRKEKYLSGGVRCKRTRSGWPGRLA